MPSPAPHLMVLTPSFRRPRYVLVALIAAAVLATLPGIAGASPRAAAPRRTAPGDGRDLVMEEAAAAAALAGARVVLPAAEQATSRALSKLSEAQTALQGALQRARDSEERLLTARQEYTQFAVDSYVHGASSSLATAFDAMVNSADVVDLGRELELIGSYHDQKDEELRAIETEHAANLRQVRGLTGRQDTAEALLARARRSEAELLAEAGAAEARVRAVESEVARFHATALSPDSPILGPIRVSAAEMAAFVRAQGKQPRLTVSIEELARYYVDEGRVEGLRADVAFAQSILETGWFSFPAGGQVQPWDNNYAGIGACDGCESGFYFPSARLGVRAQIQALRVYADPDVGREGLAREPVMKKVVNAWYQGEHPTWRSLQGRWATGAGYGEKLYELYLRMVAFAESR